MSDFRFFDPLIETIELVVDWVNYLWMSTENIKNSSSKSQ